MKRIILSILILSSFLFGCKQSDLLSPLSSVNFKITGDSMSPTFKSNDDVSLSVYIGEKLEIGDIVSFDINGDSQIKRVLAVGPCDINIKNSSLYKNMELLKEVIPDDKSTTIYDDKSFVLSSESELFVLGDNVNNSIDSRSYGPIKLNTVKYYKRGV